MPQAKRTVLVVAIGALVAGCGTSSDRANGIEKTSVTASSKTKAPVPASTAQPGNSPPATHSADASIGDTVDALAQKIRAKTPDGVRLLTFTIAAELGSGSVQYQKGDRATGYQWQTPDADLQPVDVQLVGDRKVEDNVFSISLLDGAAVDRAVASVHSQTAKDLELTALTLRLNPVTRDPQWVISATAGGRLLTFQATADGRTVKKV